MVRTVSLRSNNNNNNKKSVALSTGVLHLIFNYSRCIFRNYIYYDFLCCLYQFQSWTNYDISMYLIVHQHARYYKRDRRNHSTQMSTTITICVFIFVYHFSTAMEVIWPITLLRRARSVKIQFGCFCDNSVTFSFWHFNNDID